MCVSDRKQTAQTYTQKVVSVCFTEDRHNFGADWQGHVAFSDFFVPSYRVVSISSELNVCLRKALKFGSSACIVRSFQSFQIPYWTWSNSVSNSVVADILFVQRRWKTKVYIVNTLASCPAVNRVSVLWRLLFSIQIIYCKQRLSKFVSLLHRTLSSNKLEPLERSIYMLFGDQRNLRQRAKTLLYLVMQCLWPSNISGIRKTRSKIKYELIFGRSFAVSSCQNTAQEM